MLFHKSYGERLKTESALITSYNSESLPYSVQYFLPACLSPCLPVCLSVCLSAYLFHAFCLDVVAVHRQLVAPHWGKNLPRNRFLNTPGRTLVDCWCPLYHPICPSFPSCLGCLCACLPTCPFVSFPFCPPPCLSASTPLSLHAYLSLCLSICPSDVCSCIIVFNL